VSEFCKGFLFEQCWFISLLVKSLCSLVPASEIVFDSKGLEITLLADQTNCSNAWRRSAVEGFPCGNEQSETQWPTAH